MGEIKSSAINLQLKKLFTFGKGKRFISFSNADGKRWIMPLRNMRTAMNLYQPSGIKGKMVKALLPLLSWSRTVLRLIHAERMNIVFSDELSGLLESLFDKGELEFAVFCGTPSARQKITIQIFNKKKILAYCKVTQDIEIYKLFQQENKILKQLNILSIPDIPQPFFLGNLMDMFIFIQSTHKTNNSKISHKWTDKHSDFLDLVYQKTKKEISFEDTDFFKEISYLESLLELNNKNLLFETITILKEYYKQFKDYSFFHGDFTPWNIFIEKDNLCVFDFEYAQMSFPPYLDKVHYLLQICIIEKKLSSEKIFKYLEKLRCKKEIKLMQILAYLIHIIAFYTKLYDGQFDLQDNGYIIWSQLLKKYIVIYHETNT